VAAIKDDFTERVVQFGPGKCLVGITAQPAETSDGDKPAVVILNTGTIHRVGHHRMYVSMSRKLARAGHTVLRFDFSGLGDSAPHSSGQPLLRSNLSDIRSALDWLETTLKVSRVILIGLCSGADHAILYGHSDPRVAGLVLIDPYIPTTARYFIDYISRRMDLKSWRQFNFRKSKLMRLLLERLSRGLYRETGPQHLTFQGLDARASLEQVYHATAQARVQLLVICTGLHHAPRQTYREQFINAFDAVSFDDTLRLEFFEDADHTFSSARCRDELNDLVVGWGHATKFNRATSASSSPNPTVSDTINAWIA